MPTTTPMAKQPTGGTNTPRTMLQLSTPSTRMIQLISWGYSLDSIPSSGTGRIELIETDVACTGLTAHTASGIQPLYPGLPASLLTLGTGNTGYYNGGTNTEGTPTAVRVFDDDTIPSTAGEVPVDYDYQWMPNEAPWVNVSRFLRVRATFTAASVGFSAWVCWDE